MKYTFPKAGVYQVSVGYAHGVQLETRLFEVEVLGAPAQSLTINTYSSPGMFDGYGISMDATSARAGEVTTLAFRVEKNGEPVVDMEPHLAAVAHVMVLKNDLSEFIHTHGEVHEQGKPYPQVSVKDGKVVHSISSMTAPAKFGPNFEAHALFPSSGRYTVWVQVNMHGEIVPASFTLDIE